MTTLSTVQQWKAALPSRAELTTQGRVDGQWESPSSFVLCEAFANWRCPCVFFRTLDSLMSGNSNFSIADDKYDENEDKDNDPEDLG